MKSTEELWFLNVSDVHWDSKNCDRKLLKKHFDFIKEKNGWIFINGDFFDVMGMKRDPRSVPNDIRPEYLKQGATYLDLVIQDAYDFLKNYKDNIKVIGYGNHETNILKRQQTDPLKWLVHMLNGGEDLIQIGGYSGAILLNIARGNKKRKFTTHNSKIFYHHGIGGGAKRSKGILNADILVSQNRWADIITSGHDHNKWHLPFKTKDLNFYHTDWHKKRIEILRTGSYKLKSEENGWEVEKDFNEPTLGGWFIKYSFEYKAGETKTKSKYILRTDIIEAK